MPEVYRAPLRSRLEDVDPGAAQQRALARGLVGLGGRLPAPPANPADLAAVLAAVAEQHDERTARRVERFAAVPVGATVWTRDLDGRYRRGTLTGPWRYDADPAAVAADLVHVRPCRWEEPVEEHRAPAAVRATFRRGGRNFQRIRAL